MQDLTEEYHTALKQAWVPWNSVRKSLNGASIAKTEEVRQFKANASAHVTHLKRAFPWLNIFPKLHLLLYHAAEFMQRYGSIGMYGEQAIEAWHGRYCRSARQHSLGYEIASAAAVQRAMALAREASESYLARYGPTRKPAALGARNASKVYVLEEDVGQWERKRENATRQGESGQVIEQQKSNALERRSPAMATAATHVRTVRQMKGSGRCFGAVTCGRLHPPLRGRDARQPAGAIGQDWPGHGAHCRLPRQAAADRSWIFMGFARLADDSCALEQPRWYLCNFSLTEQIIC